MLIRRSTRSTRRGWLRHRGGRRPTSCAGRYHRPRGRAARRSHRRTRLPDEADALDWYHSEEYTAIKKLPRGGRSGNALRRGRHGRNGVEELADAALITDLPGSASRSVPFPACRGLSRLRRHGGRHAQCGRARRAPPSTSRWKWSSSHGSGRAGPPHQPRSTDPAPGPRPLVGSPPWQRVRARDMRASASWAAGDPGERRGTRRGSRSTTVSSPPAPSAATPTSPSPTRCCATSSSPPPGPRAGQPPALPLRRAHRRPGGPEAKRLIGEGARRSGPPNARPTATTRGRGRGRTPRSRAWPAPCSTTSTTSESVPVLILACYVRYRDTSSTDGASVYPACQNLLLAARALGYGGVMTGWQSPRSPSCAPCYASPKASSSWRPSRWAARRDATARCADARCPSWSTASGGGKPRTGRSTPRRGAHGRRTARPAS